MCLALPPPLLLQELLLLGYTWLSRRVLVPLVARVVPRAVLGRRRRGHSEATEPSSSAPTTTPTTARATTVSPLAIGQELSTLAAEPL